MKHIKVISVILAQIIFLTACGGTATESPSDLVNGVYTSVAMTLSTGNPTSSVTTETPLPTNTPWPTDTTDLSSIFPTSTATNISYVTSSSCDGSSFVSDVTIPDGTELDPGEGFTKTWSFKNAGTCTWSTAYYIAFISGDDMSGESTDLTASVSPSGTIDVSVDMVAPLTAGTYTGYWKLYNSSDIAFGETVYVTITVTSSATATSTATYTPTTGASTSTPTATTAASTSTTAATATTAAATATATTAPTATPAPPTATTAPSSTPVPEDTSTSTSG